MKKIISFTTSGSSGSSEIDTVEKWTKEKFAFKVKFEKVSTAEYKHIANLYLRCIISANCNEVEKQELISYIRGFASHALLESN